MFNVKSPLKKGERQLLTLQCWDRDLLKSNDLICEWSVDLTELIQDSILTDRAIMLEKKYYEKSLKDRMTEQGKIPETIKFVSKPEVGNEGYVIELTTLSVLEDEKGKKVPVTI